MLQKSSRVAAVHDLSGVGRCSLSVIMPVMSVMGIQVCPLPTAVLSTHTGGFGAVARQDLTDFLAAAITHYRSLGVGFDCVYTGYLSSTEQVRHCNELFELYPSALKIVDPVMGDHGRLYSSFTDELVAGVKSLAASADVITPNITEAAILLGDPVYSGDMTSSKIRSLLVRLSQTGPSMVVITGVTLSSGEYASVCYDKKNNAFWKSVSDHVPASYPGTGDIFASVLTASLLLGDSLPIATDRATRYVELTIKTTHSYAAPTREGVMLEKTLEWLTRNEAPRDLYNL